MKNVHANLTWTVGAQKLSCRLKKKNIRSQFKIINATGNHSSSTYETIVWLVPSLVSIYLQFKKFEFPGQRPALTMVNRIQILWNLNMYIGIQQLNRNTFSLIPNGLNELASFEAITKTNIMKQILTVKTW